MSSQLFRQVTVVEVVITYINIGWAIVMLTNPLAFTASANFARIESVFSDEWIMGVVCLLLAAVKIIGIALRRRILRWAGLMLSGVFWSFVSASFLFVGGFGAFTTGFIVYSGVAVLSFWTSREVMTHEPAAE